MTLKEILKRIKLSEQTISMVLGALVVVVMGILIFNYFRGTTQPGTVTTPQESVQQNGEVKIIEEDGKKMPANLPTNHKVDAGENLWAIAEKYYGSGYNWVDIAKANNLANANRLSVGQELNLPRVEIKEVITSEPKTEITESNQSIQGENYTVVKGDNLWNISVRAYQDGYRWAEIAKANNLTDPSIIHPGNVIKLPR